MNGRVARLSGLAAVVCLVAALICAPWLAPSRACCGWLGIAGALMLVTRLPWRAGLVCTTAIFVLAISAAFHWAPHALAQSMQSGDGLGLAVFVPLLLWEAARASLPFWLAARLGLQAAAAWLPAALIAVAFESLLPTVFPWRFGYAQIAWPVTIQSVDLFGSEGSTIIEFAHAGTIVCLGTAIVEIARHRKLQPLVALGRSAAVWVAGANLIYGLAAMHYWREQLRLAPLLTVALVQVDSTYVGSADKLRELTRSVAGNVDLVCWPEASGGTYHLDLDRLSDPDLVFRLSREPLRGMRPWPQPSCPLLFGSCTFNSDEFEPSEVYQSAVLLDSHERVIGRYHKQILMPFGEYVPGKGWLPGIERLFPLPHTVLRGEEAAVLRAGDRLRIGPMICYEDMQPQLARSLARKSANLLCALINAASFENDLTLRQHRLLAQLRAVECRRYFLRTAATGETCVISPLGEIEASLPLRTPAVLTANVALLDTITWASRWGSVVPWLCGAAVAAYGMARRRSWRPSPQSSAV